MNKFIKAIGLLSIIAIFGLGVFAQTANAQSSFINTGVTINKSTDLYNVVFAGMTPVPITLKFNGGPVAGSDLNMDLYIVAKRGGVMSKIASWNFNENACTRRCYDQTIPVSTSKWTDSMSLSIPNVLKIPYDAPVGEYSVRVAFRRGDTYAKFVPGTGVVEYNDNVIQSGTVPSYEVGTFSVVTPCTSNIDSHYNFDTKLSLVEDRYTGPEAAILQNILKTMGLYEGAVNGQYGTFTANVMKKYQKSQGLPETGTAGYYELDSINRYCNDQIRPVITKISKTDENGNVIPATSALYGEIITIEGRNFYQIKEYSNFKGKGSQVEFGPFVTISEAISVEPSKIVVRAKSLQTTPDDYLQVRNNFVYSEKFPFTVGGGNYVFGEPEIQKINGQSINSGSKSVVTELGENIKLEGIDFNLGNIMKVTFSGPTTEVVNASPSNNTVNVVVPNTLSKGQLYYVYFTDESGAKKGNSVRITVAGNVDPSILYISPTTVAPGDELEVTGTNFSKNLDLYITKGNDFVKVSPVRSITDRAIRISYKIPANIGVGEYTVSVRTGNRVSDNQSNSLPLSVKVKDTIAPSVPSKPTVTRLNDSSIRLDWAASTDNIGVVGYRVYRSGNIMPEVNPITNSVVINGIGLTQVESFSVSAFDGANNYSARSQEIEINIPPAPVLSSVTPASAKAYGYITVKGANLRSISSSISRSGNLYLVLPNSTTIELPPLSPTDTEIQATVPNLEPGDYGLRVKTYSGTSNTISFKIITDTPTATRQSPVVTSIVPSILKTGEKLVINGKNFFSDGVSTSNQISEVILTNSSNVPVTRPTIISQSDTKIEIQLPSNLQPGTYSVVVLTTRSERTKALTIKVESAVPTPAVAPAVPKVTAPATSVAPTVVPVVPAQIPAPIINSVLPLSARVNDTVTLFGSNFTGVNSDLLWITNSTGAATVGTLYQSTANTVVFKTPNMPAGTYNIELTADGGISNKIPFTVLPPLVEQQATPYISSVSPASAKANALVTVTGTNFQGVTSDLIFLESSVGMISPEIVSSSATSIVFKVPYVTAGAYKLFLLADGGESNMVDFTIESGMAMGQGLTQTATIFDWFVSLFR